MAETSNIAKMASLVSKEIFSVFGWKERPHKDQNWRCVVKKHRKTTHPSDVVFSYESPLEPGRVYVNTDLKSYAKSSIQKDKIEQALISLSMSAECANQSEEWQALYADPDSNFRTHSLLFVYNHDGAYDDGFAQLANSVKASLMKVKAAYRCYLVGPQEIRYLQTIASDIMKKRGRGELPGVDACCFYHPDLVRARVRSNTLEAATLEMLTAPWLVLKYSNPDGASKEGCVVYYRESGESVDEFKFLIDYLFRYQLVEDDSSIEIRTPFADRKASALFETAKEQYAKDYFEIPEFIARLKQITFHSVPEVQTRFSDVELGMD